MLQIQEYADQYRDQIIDLILDIQNNEFNINLTLDDQPDLLTIRAFYQKGLGNFWIALMEKKVVGTISLLDIANSQTALRKLFVHKSYRGKKHKTASLLLSSAIEWAATKEIREIFLGTTSKYHAAHKFYEKNEFEEIEKRDLPANFPIMEVDTKFYKYQV